MISYKRNVLERQSLSEINMGRGSPICERVRKKIVEHFKNNVPQRQIAKALQISSSTVHNSSKDSEKLEKFLCVRDKAEDLCWMPVVFGPSDDTASLIGMFLSWHLQRENWVSFSAQWLATHVGGTKDHLCLWKQILRGRWEQIRRWPKNFNTFYGRFESNGGIAALPSSTSGSTQAGAKRESCDPPCRRTRFEGTKGSEHQESGWTWRDYWPCPEVLRWSACCFCLLYLQWVPCYLCSSHLL